MLRLGDVPLEQWLFRHQLLVRDIMQFGWIGTYGCSMLAWLLDGQSLILTEAVLPNCPLYARGGSALK